jgi:SAM-dependent methyltransferase
MGEPRPAVQELLAEQRRYYRARAGEYEDWWYRRGRYHHGAEADERWFGEVAALERAVERLAPLGRVLELACGTGLWTVKLAASAERLLALDAAPEALALARAKLAGGQAELAEADIFAWEPPAPSFDLVFFSFWLSHVPNGLMGSFFAKVRRALAPGGRVFLIDSARSSRASARDHELAAAGEERQRRRLDDGSEYTIFKHWFEPAALAELLDENGWQAEVASTGEFFVYAEASPRG